MDIRRKKMKYDILILPSIKHNTEVLLFSADGMVEETLLLPICSPSELVEAVIVIVDRLNIGKKSYDGHETWFGAELKRQNMKGWVGE